MQAVEINSTVKIIRPDQGVAPGLNSYAGYIPDSSTILATNLPVSILLKGGNSKSITDLPTDAKEPDWIVLMPKLDSTDFRTGDIFIDQTEQNYILMGTEETQFGWRMTIRQTVN